MNEETRLARRTEDASEPISLRFELAWKMVDRADAITSAAYQKQDWSHRAKADGSPVTDVDLRVERLLRAEIRSGFPDDGLLGEEYGEFANGDEYTWLLDPIDGTANFSEGVPIFATLVSCSHRDRTVFSIVSAPQLGRRWWARAGHGAFRNGAAMTVTNRSRIDEARIAYGGLRDYGDDTDGVVALVRSCMRARGFGNFLPHMLVAEGTYDLASSGHGCSPWDVVPLALIVGEAGGCLTALNGGPWQAGDALLTSNGNLHRAATELVTRHR